MTPRDRFKVAFLARCAAGGVAPSAAGPAVRDALTKVALLSEAIGAAKDVGTGLVSHGTGWGIPALALAPVVAGAGLGYGAATLQDTDDVGEMVGDVKRQELIDEYKSNIVALRRNKEMRERAALAPARGRPVL